MAIPKHTVVEEERDDKSKHEREDARKRKLERSLERGLEDSFPPPIRSTSPNRPPPAAIRGENKRK
jgi:hypothetical protein